MMDKTINIPRSFEPVNKVFLRLSIILFVTSLFFKAYEANGKSVYGILSLALGWLACMKGGAGLSWLANPFLITAWFTSKMKSNMSLYPSILALGFSFSFLFFDRIISDEGGGTSHISKIGFGYWLWLASITVMVFGNLNRKNIELTEQNMYEKYDELTNNE